MRLSLVARYRRKKMNEIELIETPNHKWYGKHGEAETILYDTKEELELAILEHNVQWDFDLA